MTHTHDLPELTAHELTSVTGGFLPLLGLLGMGANLAGSIMGGIGKKKTQEAEQLNASNQAAAGGGGGTPQSGNGSPPAGTNLLPQRRQSCSDCSCSSSSAS